MPTLHIVRLCVPFVLWLHVLPVGAVDPPQKMRLATLEWPPYVSSKLPGNGLSTTIVEAAARQAGYALQVDFFDWTIAMDRGSRDPQFAGFFPEYATEERVQTCHESAPVGTSKLGLATLKDRPVQWDTLSDLNEYTIGIVDGYSNGTDFDTMVQQGQQPVDVVANDRLNVRKLLRGQVHAIVIDREVLRYLLADSPDRNEITFHPRLLAKLTLHVCFQRTPEGLEMQRAFDAGLKKIDMRKIKADYMKNIDP